MNPNTVFEAFTQSVGRWPDKPLMVVPRAADRAYLPEGISITYREAARMAQALVDLYRAAGYGHGHRVALLLENRPEHFLHLLALNASARRSSRSTPTTATTRSSTRWTTRRPNWWSRSAARVADLREVAAGAAKNPPVVGVEPLPDALPPARCAALPGKPDRKTEAALLYTSGTTGAAQGLHADQRLPLRGRRDLPGLRLHGRSREGMSAPTIRCRCST